jgi:hypothetical protein
MNLKVNNFSILIELILIIKNNNSIIFKTEWANNYITSTSKLYYLYLMDQSFNLNDC